MKDTAILARIEEAAIEAAHPTRTGRHHEYSEAMRLVGERHSKGDLVDLVNWLLVKCADATLAAVSATESMDAPLSTIAQKLALQLPPKDRVQAIVLDIGRLLDTEKRWSEACAIARLHCPVGDGESHIRQGIPRLAATGARVTAERDNAHAELDRMKEERERVRIVKDHHVHCCSCVGDLAEKIEKLKDAATAMRAAWSEHVHQYGFEHEDGCPEDDTCECPLVLAMNKADKALREALETP